MRYPAAEKLEIIRLVEQSHLPVRRPARHPGRAPRAGGAPPAETPEIIPLVEQSHLPVRRTLRHLGVPPATFYRWCERHRTGGPEARQDPPDPPPRGRPRLPGARR